MANFPLALDLIAPMIGGVVISGTVSFLGGVLAGRNRLEHPGTEVGQCLAPQLEAEIERLKQERIQTELKEELFGEFSSHSAISSALWSLLGRILPQPSSNFVAILGSHNNSYCPKMARGLTEGSFERLTLPDRLLRQFEIENPLAIHRDSDEFGFFNRLDAADREKANVIYLTSLNDGQENFGVIISSFLWPDGLAEGDQLAFMRRAARDIGKRCQQIHHIEQQSNELKITQDMLELRAIVDDPQAEPPETLKRFVGRLQESTMADRVAVYFVARRSGEQLQPIVQCGHPLAAGELSIWDRHERALARVTVESGIGRILDGHRLPSWPGGSPIATAAIMPIRLNGRVLGTLSLTQRGLGNSLESHRKLIEFAAETLSKTIGRVFDEATIRRQAHHDPLTNLVNRRSFDAYVTTEIERVRLQESLTCSMIFADLDHFKSINDHFGHQAGDHVLREAARILTEQVGRMRIGERSLIARYGGEEFAVLLPGVGHAGAMRIAEGIRAAIQSHSIRCKGHRIPITVSLGVAVCPDQATTVETLFSVADRAMYRAKAKGRNCVCDLEEVVI